MDKGTLAAQGDLSTLAVQVDSLKRTTRFSTEHTRWLLNSKFALEKYFGPGSDLARTFAGLTWQIPEGAMVHGPDLEGSIRRKEQETYVSQLDTAKGILFASVDRLRQMSIEQLHALEGRLVAQANRDIFITHGGRPPILEKVERIVRTLGFNPMVVIREPSLGKAADDLVPDYMKKCICSIVLATHDEENPESPYPRPNVIHEIGLAQEILRDKIIYLKEEGVDFPSNVAPKIWEPFTNDNPDPVWDKIVRELRGFGFIP